MTRRWMLCDACFVARGHTSEKSCSHGVDGGECSGCGTFADRLHCPDGPETVTDLFGERCLVLSRCERCGEPRFQRAGETGYTQFHAKGCLGLNLGAWHQDARAAQDEAGMRDIAQVESRVRNYGANVERPKDYVGPKRAPAPLGRYRSL